MPKLLDLNDSAWTLAYVRVVGALRADPTLLGVIHPDGWRTWTGDDADADPPGEDTLPSIEVLPYGMPASSQSPISQYSPLGISISIACEGSDVLDLLNLWGAVHNAIFPGDGASVLRSQIIADFQAQVPKSGAQLECVVLGMPAITSSTSAMNKQQWAANGTITLNMRVRK